MILEVVTLTSTPSTTNFLVRFRVLLEKFCGRQEGEEECKSKVKVKVKAVNHLYLHQPQTAASGVKTPGAAAKSE